MIKRMVSTLLLIVATVSLAGYADLYLPKYAANGRGGSLPKLMANCLSDVVDDIPVEELVHIQNRRTKYFQEELSLRSEEIEIELPEPYMEAYYDFLLRYWREHGGENALETRFLFAYIDEDSVPELLLVEKPDYYGTSVSVYTYYRGNMRDLGNYGTIGEMHLIDKQGKIVSYLTYMGMTYIRYHQISTGMNYKVCEFFSHMRYRLWGEDVIPPQMIYEVNGVEVTQAEYEEQYHLYQSDDYRPVGYEDGVRIVPEQLKKSLLAMKYIADSKPWKILDAYEEFLDKRLMECIDDKDKRYSYALAYLDEDNIPELILLDMSADVTQREYYTYKQGAVVLAEEMEDIYPDYPWLLYTSLSVGFDYDDWYDLREQLRAANGIDFE